MGRIWCGGVVEASSCRTVVARASGPAGVHVGLFDDGVGVKDAVACAEFVGAFVGGEDGVESVGEGAGFDVVAGGVAYAWALDRLMAVLVHVAGEFWVVGAGAGFVWA